MYGAAADRFVSTDATEEEKRVLENMQRGPKTVKEVCATCVLRKRVRSKHCSLCNRFETLPPTPQYSLFLSSENTLAHSHDFDLDPARYCNTLTMNPSLIIDPDLLLTLIHYRP